MNKLFLIFFLFPLFSFAQNWKDVGGGMTGNQPFMDGIRVLFVDTANNLLYAGGVFNTAGGVPANKIAKWDGVSWSVIGANTTPNSVVSIAVDSNAVYMPSSNFSVLKNTGGNWWALPAFNDIVYVVSVINGELYAGGDFTFQGTTPVNHIAKWNGVAWQPLGSGLYGFDVDAITEYQGKLVAGGTFLLAGGDTVRNIAIWDGTSWSALGEGLCNSDCNSLANNASVHDLYADGNDLYVAGDFIYAGGIVCNGIAKWDGSSWHNFGGGALGAVVYDVIKHKGDLYANGGFDFSFSLVKWDGINWNSYFGEEVGINSVAALASYNNEFYIGGSFDTDTNGQVLNFIARRSTFDLLKDTFNCFGSCVGTSTAPQLGVQPNTYQWSNGETTQTATNLCIGINSITVTDSSGSSSTGVMSVYSPPVITVDDTVTSATCQSCNDGSATVTASGGTPPFSYEWSNGLTTNSIDSLLFGIYTVTVTDSNGCVMIDTVIVGFDDGTNELQIADYRLQIYPNPANETVTVTAENIKEIRVTNLLGQVMQNTNYVTLKNEVELNIELLPQGIYLLQVRTNSEVRIAKFIKQ